MSTEFISIQEAADLSGKSVQTIRRAIKSKKLKVKKQKTPQGFNYLVHKESLGLVYGVKIDIRDTEKTAKKDPVSKVQKEDSQDSFTVSNDDFKRFTQTLEKMVSQHSEERQNFMRLVNTLQEKIFFLENQMNLLKEPKKKWFQVWK